MQASKAILPKATITFKFFKDVISELKETGISLIVYAPESASPRVLRDIKKKGLRTLRLATR